MYADSTARPTKCYNKHYTELCNFQTRLPVRSCSTIWQNLPTSSEIIPTSRPTHSKDWKSSGGSISKTWRVVFFIFSEAYVGNVETMPGQNVCSKTDYPWLVHSITWSVSATSSTGLEQPCTIRETTPRPANIMRKP